MKKEKFEKIVLIKLSKLEEGQGVLHKGIKQNAEGIRQNSEGIKQNAEGIRQNTEEIKLNRLFIKENRELINRHHDELVITLSDVVQISSEEMEKVKARVTNLEKV